MQSLLINFLSYRSRYLSQQMGLKVDHFCETLLPCLINLIPNCAKVMSSSGTVTIRFIIQVSLSSSIFAFGNQSTLCTCDVIGAVSQCPRRANSNLVAGPFQLPCCCVNFKITFLSFQYTHSSRLIPIIANNTSAKSKEIRK